MPKQNGQLETYELRDLFQQTHSLKPEMPEWERGPVLTAVVRRSAR